MPIATRAFAATSSTAPLSPFSFDRRDPGPDDVAIEIKFCGVCHSDLHVAKNELGNTTYPIVPGHEIAGVVTAGGGNVSRFKVGDRVGVGCMVDSCRTCAACQEGEEQYCVPGMTQTYGSADPLGEAVGQTITQGGYSDRITVKQDFVLRIPDALPLDAAAPLLCAGITTYSPLRHWIINTVSATHEIARHLNLLARDGTMVMLGLTTEGLPVFARSLLWRRRSVAGSLIGGIRETQEMLDFCAEHDIVCDIETIAPDQIDEVYDRMEKSDVRYRFVIDMARMN